MLLTADGPGTVAIMAATGKSKTCVWRWQERFMVEGFDGLLRDRTPPPGVVPLETTPIDKVVALTLEPPGHEATHRTVRVMAKAVGIAASSVVNVLDGPVIRRTMQRHRHREFTRFLNAVEAGLPQGKAVHVILDNHATHKQPRVRAWLTRHPRRTFHFVPTSCSWLNAVEDFFAKLTAAA